MVNASTLRPSLLQDKFWGSRSIFETESRNKHQHFAVQIMHVFHISLLTCTALLTLFLDFNLLIKFIIWNYLLKRVHYNTYAGLLSTRFKKKEKKKWDTNKRILQHYQKCIILPYLPLPESKSPTLKLHFYFIYFWGLGGRHNHVIENGPHGPCDFWIDLRN